MTKKVNLKTIEDLIWAGTKPALNEAFEMMENEADCFGITHHPLYPKWKDKATAIARGFQESESLT